MKFSSVHIFFTLFIILWAFVVKIKVFCYRQAEPHSN